MWNFTVTMHVENFNALVHMKFHLLALLSMFLGHNMDT